MYMDIVVILVTPQSGAVRDLTCDPQVTDHMRSDGITASTVTQKTPRDIEPMLGQCWNDVVDGGPTLAQHWFNVSCLLRSPCVTLYVAKFNSPVFNFDSMSFVTQ